MRTVYPTIKIFALTVILVTRPILKRTMIQMVVMILGKIMMTMGMALKMFLIDVRKVQFCGIVPQLQITMETAVKIVLKIQMTTMMVS